jgi:anti-sigma factor RsiW
MTVDPLDMSCKELVELVTDYLEGRLPAHDLERLEAHLTICDPCVVYIEQIRESMAVVGKLSEDDLPPGAEEVLLAQFRDWKRSRN